ncbi:MAG: ATP-dependent helicase HrpB [Cytophagaceae bacterium]
MKESLPVLEVVPELKKRLAETNTVILQAPPGAGKSTILPLQLLEEQWLQGKKILMLEPRRLAARSVANRMAQLLDEETGQTIGYRIRFETKVSSATRIEVVTEGILTRMLQKDNSLDGIGLVIFDEFHERSLHADLSLALCREAQQILREDLRIMIMSATLEGEKLSALLDNAPIITSKGRQYPVEIFYAKEDPGTSVSQAMEKVIKQAYKETEGDILAFLPGTSEILKTKELLESSLPQARNLPLYGDLPQQKQQEALSPISGQRKIVLSTSIAETSLTIEGIQVVVDSGLSRVSRFDPKSGLTRLETVKVTIDSADQRAGRAGRLGPGKCYRLWTENSHRHLEPSRVAEILEADLSPMLLELAQWGITDTNKLAWLTPPPVGAIGQAKELLHHLEALKEDKITERGRLILELPTHPRIAHMLLKNKDAKFLALATDIAAILEERDPLPKDAGSDFNLRVEALRRWREKPGGANRQILERCERTAFYYRKLFKIDLDNSTPDPFKTGALVASAYPERIAKKKDHGSYRLANSRSARLHESDPLLLEEWLAVAHMDAGTNEGRIYLASPLNPEDLPEYIYSKDVVLWDSRKDCLIAHREIKIGDLTVSHSQLNSIPEKEKIGVICNAIRKEGSQMLPWNDDSVNLQARVQSLRNWRKEEEWPDLSTEHLLETLEEWLSPYLSGIRKREDFKKLDLEGVFTGMLPWPLPQKLDELAPKQLKVPSGSFIPVQYFTDGRQPVLSVRLQELFGLAETPKINEGSTSLLLHLLSPGYKPVQVTQDLKSFWENTYPEVRKELRVRYSKHFWPEDPWTAEAVRGVKKKR